LASTSSLEGLVVLTLISIGLVFYGRAQNKENPESGSVTVSVGALGLLIAVLWFLEIVLF